MTFTGSTIFNIYPNFLLSVLLNRDVKKFNPDRKFVSQINADFIADHRRNQDHFFYFTTVHDLVMRLQSLF